MNNQKSFQKTLKISSSERGNMIKKELSSEEILFKSGKEKIMKQRKSIFDNEYEEGEKYNHKEYEDEEIKVDTSFRQYIDSILKTEKFNNIISLISFIFAIFIFFGYIVCTYFPLYNMKWFDITNVAIATFYNLETIKNFYLSQHRIIYLLSFQTIVELFTSIYPYFCFIRNYYIRTIKILKNNRSLPLIYDKQILKHKMSNFYTREKKKRIDEIKLLDKTKNSKDKNKYLTEKISEYKIFPRFKNTMKHKFSFNNRIRLIKK